MREIKFRAWDETNKVMVYNVNINNGKPVKPGYQWFNAENTILHSEPQQYTGLKDKNGKEIYEGDILRCIFEDENYIVEWDEIGAGFLFHRINNRKRTGGIDYYEFEDICGSFGFEVIGNIYEQPELWEGEE